MTAHKLSKRNNLQKAEDTLTCLRTQLCRIECRDIPRAAICSLVLTGWNPTNGTCILARVPIAYHDEYATYKRFEKRPIKINTNACNGIMFVMKA